MLRFLILAKNNNKIIKNTLIEIINATLHSLKKK